MNIHILTLFPEMLEQIFSHSILKRACDQELLQVICHQIRDYADNRHKSVDDYPYGGGCGMVMTPQPIFNVHEAVTEQLHTDAPVRTIYCTPKGRLFTQQMAEELAQEKSLIILCGHYEGVDQRVIDELVTDEISIGDYVLTGGELPAAVMVDAIARMIPGVLKEDLSYQEESLYGGLLEYPHYTRPPVFRNLQVPEVLLSGHHEKIRQWRQYQAIRETWLKRPDLIDESLLTKEELEWLHTLQQER
ncbi:MAG: tRNA (guanosine(37)-N1)-methyltransferase TrmD [Bacillota bacterium]|nr:tRNA (guanosine(37)-N1)-methyltransferase TrmD [Bacillota bacterium]MDW7676078.1 tRNA (guanosine(37)-N1)-methyltransferase TrmD [Bacillota bacterium]